MRLLRAHVNNCCARDWWPNLESEGTSSASAEDMTALPKHESDPLRSPIRSGAPAEQRWQDSWRICFFL